MDLLERGYGAPSAERDTRRRTLRPANMEAFYRGSRGRVKKGGLEGFGGLGSRPVEKR
jgi:hypothetical protein